VLGWLKISRGLGVDFGIGQLSNCRQQYLIWPYCLVPLHSSNNNA